MIRLLLTTALLFALFLGKDVAAQNVLGSAGRTGTHGIRLASNNYFPNAPEKEPTKKSKRKKKKKAVIPLLPLEEELANHGGSHLYVPEGDETYARQHGLQSYAHQVEDNRMFAPPALCPVKSDDDSTDHYHALRLPEDFQIPKPFTLFAEFQGADPIQPSYGRKWFGPNGYAWEPRFVGYGSYSLFAFAFEENNRRQDGIAHHMLVELDLKLTGTERFHVQFRPFGKKGTGGSSYLFSDPEGYVDNSTLIPDRYWFEGELGSIFSSWANDPFTAHDWNIAVGTMPFALHNQLLMNDDVAGVVLSKNTIFIGNTSNVNWQGFYFFENVDAFSDGSSDVVGMNTSIDYQRIFIEATYAYRTHSRKAGREAHYFALSGTQLFGALSLAGRAMFKVGDERGTGSGELFVLESNFTRIFDSGWQHNLGIHHGVYYVNAFYATEGWQPITAGGFNRLRSVFEVSPLVSIARGDRDNTAGAAVGVQLFRHHEDESLTPEFAYETPNGTAVWGVGLRYQRKTSVRSFLSFQGIINWSADPALERTGAIVSHTWLY